jgi:hypothetical protein
MSQVHILVACHAIWLSDLVYARVRLPTCCMCDWTVHESRYQGPDLGRYCLYRRSPGIVRLAAEIDSNFGSFGISRAPR